MGEGGRERECEGPVGLVRPLAAAATSGGAGERERGKREMKREREEEMKERNEKRRKGDWVIVEDIWLWEGVSGSGT